MDDLHGAEVPHVRLVVVLDEGMVGHAPALVERVADRGSQPDRSPWDEPCQEPDVSRERIVLEVKQEEEREQEALPEQEVPQDQELSRRFPGPRLAPHASKIECRPQNVWRPRTRPASGWPRVAGACGWRSTAGANVPECFLARDRSRDDEVLHGPRAHHGGD